MSTAPSNIHQLKNYLKTKFLSKLDNSELQLSKTARSRLIFSKYLRYKNTDLVIDETEGPVLTEKGSRRLQIIIRWLMSSKYSEGLLSSLDELDWVCYILISLVNCTVLRRSFVTYIFRQIVNKLQSI